MRLTLSGDSVQIGPPMVDPPRLRPATPPTPLTPPSPPPYIQQSSYGQLSYTQSPYTDEPYSDSPYVVKPLDNQPHVEPQYNSQLTPVPHPSYQQRPQPQPEAAPPAGAPNSGAPNSGGGNGMSTAMVAVGTVQPRAPQPPASVEDAERVLGAAVDSLDADPDLYSIGTVTDGAVCLVPDDGRWAVFLADGGQRRFAGSFDDPMLAAVHFAGVLLLAATERGALPRQAAPAPAALPGQSGQSEQNGQGDHTSQNGHSDQPGRGTDPLAEFLAGPPITPLAQDPPTTLYTDHRLTVLTPGTEVDRFGDQLGNTVYAARTRYPHRSLPPDYIEREYRVYRVRDPLRALAGTAIPWFGQPGGGTAYLLPRPIQDLLREGALVEIPSATVGPA